MSFINFISSIGIAICIIGIAYAIFLAICIFHFACDLCACNEEDDEDEDNIKNANDIGYNDERNEQ